MSYNDQLRTIANQYFETHEGLHTARAIAAWGLDQGLLEPQPSDFIDQFAAQIAAAMREEQYQDPQGRMVRTKHAARITQGDHQLNLWADIRTGSRDHIHLALQQRRHQILGECKQLKTDMDSFNENRSPENPIQLSFNFVVDLEELAAASQPN